MLGGEDGHVVAMNRQTKTFVTFNPRIKLCSVSRAFPACLCRYSLKFRRSSRQRENGRHLKNRQYLKNKNTLGTLRRFFNQKFRWGRTDDDVTNGITALCHTPISGPTEITRKQPHCKLISLGRVSMKQKKPNRRFKAKWLIWYSIRLIGEKMKKTNN